MDHINFLCKSLGTSLHTNVVTADGYEINNLLKDETITTSHFPATISMINPRNNGFMAEYFVKPPVDIVVQFPCLVDIDCLVVNCRSGSKKVSQFDVSTSCSKPCSEGTDDNNRRQDIKLDSKCLSDSFENLQNYPVQYIPDISSTEIRKQNISSLNLVGRYDAKYFKNDLVIFKNPRNSRGKGNEYHTKGMGTMNFFSLKYLYGASHLIVRVLRTEGSTVVAVNRLEVWGKPSRMNSTFIQGHVYSLYNRNRKQTKDAECATRNNSIASSQKTISHEQEQCAKSTTTSNVKCKVDERDSGAIPEESLDKKELGAIPEEFLDKITLDVMVLPMLLPSGHTIDNTTLEKCIAQDRMNGRPPSDPFTGVPFTGNNNPVPNTSLKARLDKYLLGNSGKISKVSKPVGNTTGTKESEGGTIDRVLGVKRKAVFCDNSESINKKAKEKRDNVQCHVETGIQRDIDDKSQRLNTNWSGEIRNNSEYVCHEDTLKESLETALNAVSKVSMIRKANCIKDSLQPFCCSCKEANNEAGFFKMPCNHVICRKCITADKAVKKCSKCFMPFNNHDLERVHFNAYFNR